MKTNFIPEQDEVSRFDGHVSEFLTLCKNVVTLTGRAA
jgi:hypothetical protein